MTGTHHIYNREKKTFFLAHKVKKTTFYLRNVNVARVVCVNMRMKVRLFLVKVFGKSIC